MSKEKTRCKEQAVRIGVHLSEEESSCLKQCADACGLSVSEFLRQIIRGNSPQPKPPKEFWALLDALYEAHDVSRLLAPDCPEAAETCREIEALVLHLQQGFTSPQPLAQNGQAGQEAV